MSHKAILQALPRLFVAALTTTAIFATVPGPANAAFPGQNGKIAFASDRDENIELYSINPDGSNLTRLTTTLAQGEGVPKWTPDGTEIAFRPGWIMNADGSNKRPQPLVDSWSPDGERRAYREREMPFSCWPDLLFTSNRDGSNKMQVPVAISDGHDHHSVSPESAWSPDGGSFAFAASPLDVYQEGCDYYTPDVYVVNTDGTGLLNLTSTLSVEVSKPDWSPDGSKVAFTGGRSFYQDGEIYVVNRDGTGLTNLTNSTEVESDPTWSPDGTKIAFTRIEADGSNHIFVMNPDGSAQTHVDGGPFTVSSPDWQPLPTSSPPPPYNHPQLASPVSVSLVPNYRQTISNSQCTARGGLNSGHGPPLAFAACNPPGFVPGTIAHMGPASDSWVSYAVIYGDTNAANGDQANVTLRTSLNDIRTSAGTDYPASLTLVTKLRITDRFNGGSQSDSATVTDFDYSTPVSCASTAGPEGAVCNLDTSADAITADTIKENKATVLQVFRFRVNDSGANGTRGDSDDRTFATQGIYIP